MQEDEERASAGRRMHFIGVLGELRNGQTLAELHDKLTELTAAVRATGKPGKMVFSLSIRPASKGDTDTLFLQDKVKVDIPQADRKSSIFYATDENELQREDPRQMKMDLKVIELVPDKNNLKEVG